MGNLSQEPIVLPYFKVTLHRSSTIYPSEETERRLMFLSNTDQLVNFNVKMVHFFLASPEFPSEMVTEKLEASLARLLMPYDFLAGRLRFNLQQNRFEIDCNSAGVGFRVASSELALNEIKELRYNQATLEELVGNPDKLGQEDQPLAFFQVTSFKCGGFALGISWNHATLDGISFKVFLENLALLAAGGPLALTPYNNRELLAARSPPHVTFSHIELVQPGSALNGEPKNTITSNEPENLVCKLFQLSTIDISNLKEKAKKEGGDKRTITSFNVVAAHLWRCKILATTEAHPEKDTTVLYAMDIRSKIRPPLPHSYAGNPLIMTYGAATCHDLAEGPFARLVEAVWEGQQRMTDEYIKSVIDWIELHKGLHHGDMFLSTWMKLRFTEVEYPWGRPIYVSPTMTLNGHLVILFPDIKGTERVNAFLTLPSKNMEKFHDLFHKFLE